MNRRLPLALLLTIAGLVTGCGGDPDPVYEPEPTVETRPTARRSLAGVWRRTMEDGPEQVFTVTEAEGRLHGELTEGFPEDCTAYAFDLTLSSEEVYAGRSTLSFSEEDGGPDSEYSSAWKTRLVGDTIHAEVEWIAVDEFGDVSERGWNQVVFAFTPARPTPEEIDAGLRDALVGVKAPPVMPIGSVAGLGLGLAQMRESPDGSEIWGMAVVDETDDAWRVELMGGPLLQVEGLADAVMGLTINKSDGKVTRAVVGYPGDSGVEVGILELELETAAEPEGTPEQVELAAGTYAANKVVTEYGTSWSGTEGDLAGVLLKWEDSDQSYELASPPVVTEVEVGGRTLQALVVSFTNDMEWWLTTDRVVRSFLPYGPAADARYGFLRSANGGTLEEVVRITEESSAQLRWE